MFMYVYTVMKREARRRPTPHEQRAPTPACSLLLEYVQDYPPNSLQRKWTQDSEFRRVYTVAHSTPGGKWKVAVSLVRYVTVVCCLLTQQQVKKDGASGRCGQLALAGLPLLSYALTLFFAGPGKVVLASSLSLDECSIASSSICLASDPCLVSVEDLGLLLYASARLRSEGESRSASAPCRRNLPGSYY